MAFARQLNTISKCIFPIWSSKTLARSSPTVKLDFLSRNITSVKDIHEEKEIKVVFIKDDGEKVEVKGKVGDTMVDCAVKNGLINPDKLCQGTLACSYCHFIFTEKDYDRLPKQRGLELDAIDDHICDYVLTSRLGCQIELTEDLDGIKACITPDQYA